VGKPKGKRPLGRPRCRWEYVTRIDLREVGWRCGVDLAGLGYRPEAGCCENGDETWVLRHGDS
jgi:hypothetical protein